MLKTLAAMLVIGCGAGVESTEPDAGDDTAALDAYRASCEWCGDFCNPAGSKCCNPKTGFYCVGATTCEVMPGFFGNPATPFCAPHL